MKKFSKKIEKEGQVHLGSGPALNAAGKVRSPSIFSAWAGEGPGESEQQRPKIESRPAEQSHLTVSL